MKNLFFLIISFSLIGCSTNDIVIGNNSDDCRSEVTITDSGLSAITTCTKQEK